MEPNEITFFDNNNSLYDIVDMRVFYKDNYSSIIYMWNDIINYIKESEYKYDIASFEDHVCIKLLKEKPDVVGTKSETTTQFVYEMGDEKC